MFYLHDLAHPSGREFAGKFQLKSSTSAPISGNGASLFRVKSTSIRETIAGTRPGFSPVSFSTWFRNQKLFNICCTLLYPWKTHISADPARQQRGARMIIADLCPSNSNAQQSHPTTNKKKQKQTQPHSSKHASRTHNQTGKIPFTRGPRMLRECKDRVEMQMSILHSAKRSSGSTWQWCRLAMVFSKTKNEKMNKKGKTMHNLIINKNMFFVFWIFRISSRISRQ